MISQIFLIYQVLNPLPTEQGLADVLQNKLRYGGPEETFEDETVDIQYFISEFKSR